MRYPRHYASIAGENPKAADKWRNRIRELISLLERFALSYEVIPEARRFRLLYRHKKFGKYRIIYRIENETVIIVRVVHGARIIEPSQLREF